MRESSFSNRVAFGILRPGGKELEGEHRTAIYPRAFEDVAYELDQGRYGGPRNGEDASRSCRYRESPPCVIVVQRSAGRSVRSSVVPSGQVMRTRTAPAASPRPSEDAGIVRLTRSCHRRGRGGAASTPSARATSTRAPSMSRPRAALPTSRTPSQCLPFAAWLISSRAGPWMLLIDDVDVAVVVDVAERRAAAHFRQQRRPRRPARVTSSKRPSRRLRNSCLRSSYGNRASGGRPLTASIAPLTTSRSSQPSLS